MKLLLYQSIAKIHTSHRLKADATCINRAAGTFLNPHSNYGLVLYIKMWKNWWGKHILNILKLSYIYIIKRTNLPLELHRF